jgi:hypothetical protein
MVSGPGRQKGAMTMFSAILILILLTEMLIYAVQVGVFEQRKSGNEMRHKEAFHAAETGIQAAHSYLLENTLGLTDLSDSGWLSDNFVASGGEGRWVPCADAGLTDPSGTHPCYGEPLDSGSPINLRDSSYFFSLDGVTPAELPIQPDVILPEPEETVTVEALLCLLDVDRTPGSVPVRGCLDKNDGNMNPIYFVITLLARGQAECSDEADGDCAAETLVAQKLGSFGPLTGAGGVGAPLTSRSSFPPGGTAEIVPNPNGGGPGVPVSAWLNANTTDPKCQAPDMAADPTGGSWTTCERHEWYGVDKLPDENSPNGKYACPTATCSCGPGEKYISHAEDLSLDIIIDEQFPCDLFEHTFNVPRDDYKTVKYGPGVQVIKNCDSLGPDSKGTYWVDGSVGTCKLNSVEVGSPDNPVFLISAADEMALAGNAVIWGVLFVTTVEGGTGEMSVTGTNTLYGAGIVEGPIKNFNGTYQIVYNDDLVDRATKTGGLGKIYGGWIDFHEDWR